MAADDEKGANCIDTLKSKPIRDPASTPPQPISAIAEKAIAAAGKLLVLPP
jgi:hypothetical protein